MRKKRLQQKPTHRLVAGAIFQRYLIFEAFNENLFGVRKAASALLLPNGTMRSKSSVAFAKKDAVSSRSCEHSLCCRPEMR